MVARMLVPGPMMRGLQKMHLMARTHRQTNRRTWRLYDQLSPVGPSWWKKKNMKKKIRTKWTGFIRWRIGLIRGRRIEPVRRRIKPDCRRIMPVHLVPIFSQKWPLVFLIRPFLIDVPCPKWENNTIMKSQNCLFFQDIQNETVNYPFNKWYLIVSVVQSSLCLPI